MTNTQLHQFSTPNHNTYHQSPTITINKIPSHISSHFSSLQIEPNLVTARFIPPMATDNQPLRLDISRMNSFTSLGSFHRAFVETVCTPSYKSLVSTKFHKKRYTPSLQSCMDFIHFPLICRPEPHALSEDNRHGLLGRKGRHGYSAEGHTGRTDWP